MEVKLGSKLTFEPTQTGALSIQLWKCGNWRDGHGYLLSSGAIIEGDELAQFLASLQPPEQPEAA